MTATTTRFTTVSIGTDRGAKTYTVVDSSGLPVESIERWLDHLRARGNAPNTISVYATAVAQWFTVTAAYGRDWRKAGEIDVDAYITALKNQRGAGSLALGTSGQEPRSVVTINSKLAGLYEFYRWYLRLPDTPLDLDSVLHHALTVQGGTGQFRHLLVHTKRRKPRPSGLYLKARTSHRSQVVFTPDELSDLYRAMPMLDERDRLILLLSLETGLRPGEMLTLKHRNVTTAGSAPKIEVERCLDHPSAAQAKSGYREIRVGARVADAYNDYVWSLMDDGIDVEVQDLASSFVLVNLKDEWRFKPMSPSSLSDRVPTIRKAVAATGGTVRRWTWHAGRHTHATALLLAGVPDIVVKERLGHAWVQTTIDTYGHVTKQAQEEALLGYDRFIGGVPL